MTDPTPQIRKTDVAGRGHGRSRGPALLAILAMLVVPVPGLGTSSSASAATAAASIKWHPGHYVALDGILRKDDRLATNLAAHEAHIKELKNEPYVKGVKIFVQWSALEGAKPGDYREGTDLLRKYVGWVNDAGKQLWISFMHTQFNGYNRTKLTEYFPEYIVNDPAYGVTELDGDRGIMARTWQADTMTRIIEKSKYYASQFNAHPRVEAIQIGETSIGITEGTDGFSSDAVVEQYKRFYTEARKYWPNTGLRLTANYIRDDRRMIDLISSCLPVPCAVGGPDVIPTEDIQANRVFTGETGGVDHRDKMPFVAEVQSPSLCGHEGCWTPRKLYDHAMKGDPVLGIRPTQPRYFIWWRNTYQGEAPYRWHTGILPFIREIKGAVHSTACPTAYPGCITT